MLNKNLFKTKILELFEIHGRQIPELPENTLKLWYEELKELKDEDFIIAAERVKFSPRISLYYILINLPDYDKEKDKTIKDYNERRYGGKYERVYGF